MQDNPGRNSRTGCGQKRGHVGNVLDRHRLGRYSFQLPELPGGLRPLRDKDATDDQ
ncbi:hypothetical protein [Streptomyces sp. NPDC005077]|uniref:hypothetical protein n=1 Tax=Streptomyces sp. NPDC005077 TaxID=3154292 RepID=UPI0033B83DAE